MSAVVNFLTYFSDIGLAAALIQKKEALTREDLVTTFTIQQIMVVSLIIILFVLSPFLKSSYNLSTPAVYLMLALGISLLFSSLKTIPSALLERELQFNKLVIPQILETLVFNISVIFFAFKGYGVTAFTISVLLRGLVGLVAMYIVNPWKPGLGINKEHLKHLLKFGLPYQTNSFMAVIKDDGMTIILGKIIGQTGLGFIGWATGWAYLPLRFFMDNVTKVAFPAYSRVQDDPEALKKGIEKTLFYLTLVSFPIFMGMGIMAHPVINFFPKYQKWNPALILLYLYLINAAWASVSTPLTNALNATGKIKITFKLMIMWTVLTWALMPILGIKFGYVGVALAASIISFSSIVVLIVVKRIINISLVKSLRSPVLATLAMGAVLYGLTPLLKNIFYVPPFIFLGAMIYFAVIYLFEGREFFSELKTLLKMVIPSRA